MILNYKFFYYLFPFLFFAGCSVGPSYNPPPIEVPTEWKNKQNNHCMDGCEKENQEFVYLDYWWEIFEDPTLEELEIYAINNNKDILLAYDRIKEARALMGIAASNFYPKITLNPLTTNTVQLIKNYRNPNVTNQLDNNNPLLIPLTQTNPFRVHQMLYLLPFNYSYEVDLWGKIRDQYDSTYYSWRAQKRNYDAVMLTLTTNLATAYYQLRTADTQIEDLLKVIKTREKNFEINQARYEGRIIFYADVTLAAEDLDLALNQYQEILRQRQNLENQIAILMGIPASEFKLESMPLNLPPPCIPEGIPSEVLLRRPDIAEAEDLMKSQHALVKSAYTEFFPSLVLTGAGGFESPLLKFFLRGISRYWTDTFQVNQLIFDGGATYNNLELQIARFRESGDTYQQQVLVAFQEVEDSLADLNSYYEQYDVSLNLVGWAKKTNQLYRDRYELGVTDYINVANTERDLLNYEISSASLLGLKYLSTINLIKALGGGWDENSNSSLDNCNDF